MLDGAAQYQAAPPIRTAERAQPEDWKALKDFKQPNEMGQFAF